MLIVITPADNRKLVSLATVKAELGISGSGDEVYLNALIDQASAAIETWCDRVFAIERVREILDELSGEYLMVSRYPVTEVFTASTAGSAIDVDTVEIDDAGFLYRVTSGIRSAWASGRTIIEYEAGFVLPDEAEATLPADISRAALLMVTQAYLARGRDPLIKTEETYQVGSTTYGLAGLDKGYSLPPEVEGLLARYQNSAGF